MNLQQLVNSESISILLLLSAYKSVYSFRFRYVYCFVNNNVWSGALYYCPGATYFDSATRYCSPSVPARCDSSTQSLYLRGYELVFDDAETVE